MSGHDRGVLVGAHYLDGDHAVAEGAIAAGGVEWTAEALYDEWPTTNHLDTLATAYAAAGRWNDALRSAERALAEARVDTDAAAARELTRRLEGFRRHEPWISAPPEWGS